MNEFIYNNGNREPLYPYVGEKGGKPYAKGEVAKYTEIIHNNNKGGDQYKTGEVAKYNEFNYNRGTKEVETKEELINALANGGRAYIKSSITLDAPIAVAANAKTSIKLAEGATITCSSSENKGAAFKLDSKESTLVIEGEGKLSSAIGVWAEKGMVVVDGGEFSNTNQCVRLFNNVKGQALENVDDVKLVINHGKFEGGVAGIASFGGTVEINDGEFENGYYAITGNGTEGWNNTKCIINGGTFKATTVDDCAAIFWPSKGKLVINGGKFEGADAIYIKTGEVEINGGEFKAVGSKKSYVYSGSGFNTTGDTIVIDRCNYPGEDAKVVINGGTFETTAADTHHVAIYYGNGDTKETTVGTFTNNVAGLDVKEYSDAAVEEA